MSMIMPNIEMLCIPISNDKKAEINVGKRFAVGTAVALATIEADSTEATEAKAAVATIVTETKETIARTVTIGLS